MAPRLYAALGLEQAASPADVKKAYHTLALSCHPDKVGPSGEEQFKKINEAYTILRDPQKRAVYDTQGERGLELLNNEFATPLRDELGMQSFLMFVSVFFLITMVCIVAGISCVASKVDGHIGASWAVALTPFWIWDAILVIVALHTAILLVRRRVGGDATVTPQHFVMSIGIFMFVLWHALIAANLDNGTMRWIGVMVPAILLEVANFLAMVKSLRPAAVRASFNNAGITTFTCFDVYWVVIYAVCSSLWRLFTWLLLGWQADGSLGAGSSWLVPFVPAFIMAGMFVLNSWLTAWLVARNHLIDSADNLCQRTFVPLFQLILPLTTLILCGMRADEGPGFMSAGDCVAPLLIQLCLMLIGSWTLACFTITRLLNNIHDLEAAESAAAESGPGPTTTAVPMPSSGGDTQSPAASYGAA